MSRSKRSDAVESRSPRCSRKWLARTLRSIPIVSAPHSAQSATGNALVIVTSSARGDQRFCFALPSGSARAKFADELYVAQNTDAARCAIGGDSRVAEVAAFG